jgi:hypothetical protein
MRRLLVSLVGLTSPLVRSYAVTPSLQRLPHIRGGSRHTSSTASAVDIEQLIVERTESVRAPPLDTRTYRHVTLRQLAACAARARRGSRSRRRSHRGFTAGARQLEAPAARPPWRPCCRPSAPRLAAARCQQAGAAHARDAHGTHTTDSERLTHCVTLARVSLHCLHRPEKGNPRSGHRAATRDHPRARGRASRDRGRSREIEGERAVIRQVDTAPGVNSILSRSSLARPARLSRARPRHAAHRRARRQRCSRSSAPSAGCCRA